MTRKGVIRGKTIELNEPLPLPDGQSVVVEVEPLQASVPDGSPASVLRAIQALPRLTSEDVDELMRAIDAGRMPVRSSGIFDDET